MRNFFMGLWRDESGAAAAEYALILAIVGVGIAAGAAGLGDEIVGAMDGACDQLNGSSVNGTWTAGTGGC